MIRFSSVYSWVVCEIRETDGVRILFWMVLKDVYSLHDGVQSMKESSGGEVDFMFAAVFSRIPVFYMSSFSRISGGRKRHLTEGEHKILDLKFSFFGT